MQKIGELDLTPPRVLPSMADTALQFKRYVLRLFSCHAKEGGVRIVREWHQRDEEGEPSRAGKTYITPEQPLRVVKSRRGPVS